MTIVQQSSEYINSQTEPKRSDMRELHSRILQVLPSTRLWFDNGKNADGKVITNPTIGYGCQILKYANGKTKDFFQIGLSSNTTGLSVYILGLEDKTYLKSVFGKDLGKVRVTGYCIKFKRLKDVNVDVLEEAIRYGMEATSIK